MDDQEQVVDINQRSQLSHHPSPEKFSLELRYVQKKKKKNIYKYEKNISNRDKSQGRKARTITSMVLIVPLGLTNLVVPIFLPSTNLSLST